MTEVTETTVKAQATVASAADLMAASNELRAAAEAAYKEERESAISMCNVYINAFGISAFELKFSGAKAKKPRKAKEAKAPTHRGPNGELWTEGNQGRKPNWITALIAGGGDLEQYRIPAQV